VQTVNLVSTCRTQLVLSLVLLVILVFIRLTPHLIFAALVMLVTLLLPLVKRAAPLAMLVILQRQLDFLPAPRVLWVNTRPSPLPILIANPVPLVLSLPQSAQLFALFALAVATRLALAILFVQPVKLGAFKVLMDRTLVSIVHRAPLLL